MKKIHKKALPSTQSKRTKKPLDIFLTFIIIAGFSFTIAIFLNELDSSNDVREAGTVLNVQNQKPADIKQNLEKEVTYDYSEIKPVTADNVKEALANVNIYDLPVVAGLAIPDLDLNLPIINGVSDAGMFTGATTLDPTQVLGAGNYPLSSHRSIYDDVLFGPLPSATKGMPVYVSDLEYVYEYRVASNETVSPDRVDVLDPTDDARLTLITCTKDSKSRVIVIAELESRWEFDDAPQDIVDALAIDPSNGYHNKNQ